ncbi:DNA double-strand break repair nuclease NurA [Infirmifilum lucidum]|uniref:DNA double-strand break repair nuclease NurA n=1 Tax=Infirmifilum lucidum TaxID=2776706 RepID=A0A7L9FHB8_9CREN|nr:DNA double-strand break repair nuclease NurA [Infirmifilum lucidum]QOJ78314.1 DNA double-strand break repair nuclease NurA [Infirmifilum lucidum]
MLGLEKTRLLREIEEIVLRAKRELEEPGTITSSRQLNSSWFIDGSYAISERQGSFVSALSVASLGVVSKKLVEGLPGAKHPLLHILIPKFYGETRASSIMGSLELIEGIRALRRNIEAVVFDGSYLASLLSGYGPLYDSIAQLQSRLKNHQIVLREILEGENVDETINSATDAFIEKACKEAELSKLYKIAHAFLQSIYDFADSIYSSLVQHGVDMYVDKQLLIDFSTAFVENNLYLRLLAKLLLSAEENNATPVWVAKETASRFLSDKLNVRSWLNDTVLLEWVWHNREKVYLVLDESSRLKSLKPVTPPQVPVASQDTIEHAYRFSRFTVVYFKLSKFGPVLQMTFPSDLVARDVLEDVLATMSAFADERSGYPKPLSLVHHKALIQQGLVDVLATRLWQNSSGVFRAILSPLGREFVL